jgi:hypothetical protein
MEMPAGIWDGQDLGVRAVFWRQFFTAHLPSEVRLYSITHDGEGDRLRSNIGGADGVEGRKTYG